MNHGISIPSMKRYNQIIKDAKTTTGGHSWKRHFELSTRARPKHIHVLRDTTFRNIRRRETTGAVQRWRRGLDTTPYTKKKLERYWETNTPVHILTTGVSSVSRLSKHGSSLTGHKPLPRTQESPTLPALHLMRCATAPKDNAARTS